MPSRLEEGLAVTLGGAAALDLALGPPRDLAETADTDPRPGGAPTTAATTAPILLRLATERRFAEPLRAFARRRAYANLCVAPLVPRHPAAHSVSRSRAERRFFSSGSAPVSPRGGGEAPPFSYRRPPSPPATRVIAR